MQYATRRIRRQFIITICRNFRCIFSLCPIRLICLDQVRIWFIHEPAAMLPNPFKKKYRIIVAEGLSEEGVCFGWGLKNEMLTTS